MVINTSVKKSSGRYLKYGLWHEPNSDPVTTELHMIRKGGQWKKQDGTMAGNGLAFHFRKFQELVWPDRLWEKGPFKNYWAEKCLEVYLQGTYIGLMGCAGAGKSDSMACNGLTDWYSEPWCTTVLVSSTDLMTLDRRIWGMITQYHKLAKRKSEHVPGNLIEGKRVIIQDARNEHVEGRDFKNGLLAVPTKRGNQYVGLSSLIGIHNKRIILLADESQLMPRGFLDATANLSQNPFFKMVALGNPNETTNAHGTICEPAIELGGWEGGMDQSPGTKIWKTKFPNGLTLQLPASDSPNLKAPSDQPPPFDFLPTAQKISDSAQIWGTDDWHHQMFIEAKMPRGQGSRRVLTRQACVKNHAFDAPSWRDSRITKIAFLDAAYRGVGGDRCVFGELQFGYETDAPSFLPADETGILDQTVAPKKGRQIMALIDMVIVPVVAEKDSDQPEEQIVNFVQGQLLNRGIPHQNLYYDAGMRTSLVSAFARAGLIQINTVDCGGRPSEDMVSAQIQKKCCDYYSKFVTELWYSVRMVVDSEQFRGLTEEACTEFCQREWKMVSGNRIEVESKAEMKLKTGRSPDLADSIAVGVYGARKRGFIISRATSSEGGGAPRKREGWKQEAMDKSSQLRRSGALTYS